MNPIKGTVNYVELIGWLGSDPQDRLGPSGVAICSFSVATKRPGKRQEDGSWTYETEWVDVEAFDRLAETVAANLSKGSRVRVTGSLRTHTWEDSKGTKRKSTVVRAEDVLFLDTRNTVDDASVAEASD